MDEAIDLTSSLVRVGLLSCFGIMLLVFWMIHREIARRTRSEQSLKISLDKIERISHENELIGKMGDYLQSCQKIEELHSIVADTVPKLMPGMSGAVMLLNNSRTMLQVAVSWGDIVLPELEPDQCWALRRGQMHSSFSDKLVCGHIAPLAVDGSICIPMQAHGQILGLLTFASNEPFTMNDETENMLRRVGEQISLAVANLTLQASLREQSIRDPLTRLFNRRYLIETLERELARAVRRKEPVSVMIIDIDHFKKFNDALGHEAGDALLVQFAKLLNQKLRKEDMACRYGGEEFVVVMPSASLENGTKRAQEICDATRQMQAMFGGKQIGNVTVSIGVTDNGIMKTPSDILQFSDKALYEAKNGGRNRVVVATLDAADDSRD